MARSYDYDPDILGRADRARRREGACLMASNIDPSIPPSGRAYTDGVRNNFAAAKGEIETLQAAALGGGVTKTDRSGVIALGGQPQALMPANPSRVGWSFQNKSQSNMYYDDIGLPADPASNSSTYLPPGAYYESEQGGASVGAISLYGDATNAQFAAKEW
jgi:hypothetical protein